MDGVSLPVAVQFSTLVTDYLPAEKVMNVSMAMGVLQKESYFDARFN